MAQAPDAITAPAAAIQALHKRTRGPLKAHSPLPPRRMALYRLVSCFPHSLVMGPIHSTPAIGMPFLLAHH